MNSNLPDIRRESIFTKIKNWFKKIFSKEEVIIEEVIEEINQTVDEIKNISFKDSIKVKSKDRILFLKRKIKEKEIEMIDLTDEELYDLIDLYKDQIRENKKIIKQYKEKLKKLKKEE